MDNLVNRLSNMPHRVELSLPERTIRNLKERLDTGYIHIRFLDTRGGTELGVRLDKSMCDFSEADIQGGRGVVKLVGTLTLNYTPVRCFVNIDLESFDGQGYLQPAVSEGA